MIYVTNSSQREVVERALRGFLEDQCNLGELDVQLDTALFSSGNLTSLDMIDFVCFVESRFGFKIPPRDSTIEFFDTLNLMIDYVLSKVNE